jgi:hypothetical protein
MWKMHFIVPAFKAAWSSIGVVSYPAIRGTLQQQNRLNAFLSNTYTNGCHKNISETLMKE